MSDDAHTVPARHREQAACEGVWHLIGNAPVACHVLAAWFEDACGEWVMDVVESPPKAPYTHWRMLNTPALATLPKPEQPPVEASEQGEVTQEDKGMAAFVLNNTECDYEAVAKAMMHHRTAAIRTLEAEVARLKAAKWDVKHVDTANEIVQMGMARDDAEARATAAEAKLAEARKLGSWYPPKSETFEYQASGYASGWAAASAAYRHEIRKALSPKEPS